MKILFAALLLLASYGALASCPSDPTVGFYWYGSAPSEHSVRPTWEAFEQSDNETDCEVQHWTHLEDDKWVEVTEEEFMQVTCLSHVDLTSDGYGVFYPRAEWRHCDDVETDRGVFNVW